MAASVLRCSTAQQPVAATTPRPIAATVQQLFLCRAAAFPRPNAAAAAATKALLSGGCFFTALDKTGVPLRTSKTQATENDGPGEFCASRVPDPLPPPHASSPLIHR